MKIKSKTKLISKNTVFAKLERLEAEPLEKPRVAGLLLGVMSIVVISLCIVLAK